MLPRRSQSQSLGKSTLANVCPHLYEVELNVFKNITLALDRGNFSQSIPQKRRQGRFGMEKL